MWLQTSQAKKKGKEGEVMRKDLLTKTVETLEDFNFNILVYLYSCLDIAAQKKSLMLLIKVLENIDGFRNSHAKELKKLGFCFNACPLLIGENTKAYKMNDGVLYDRYGVTAITLGTLHDTLAGAYPDKIYSKGRIIAEIDGSELKKLRKKKHLSAEELARRINLTRESIYLYESQKTRMKYEIAKKIENFLSAGIIQKPSFLEPVSAISSKPQEPLRPSPPRGMVGKRLVLFDFEVTPFSKLNFDLIARDPSTRVVVREEISRHPEKILEFSDFFKAFLAFISEQRAEDIPIIKKKELKEIDSKKEFLSLLKERSSKAYS